MSSSSKFFAKKNGFYNKKKPVNVLTNPLATQSSSKSSTQFLTEEYKHLICSNSYLGKKGYTVPKEFLVKDDLDFLYKDLFCKPVTFGPQVAQPECAFPVYKENAKKIYIPRFYGIERYGLPEKSEIEYGEQIELTFEKPLRDYQDKIIDVYMKHVIKPNVAADTNPSLHNSGGGILEVPCGRGKCLAKDTPILMYDGSINPVQDVQIGDILMGDDSRPRIVQTLARGKEKMYRIDELDDNHDKVLSSYSVNESHMLSLKSMYKDSPDSQNNDKIYDISVRQYLQLPKYFQGKRSPLHGYRVPIAFQKQPILEDPYTMGYNIGNDENDYTQIPHNYKCNIRTIQMEVLAGIIDYSGQISSVKSPDPKRHILYRSYQIIQTSNTLIDDIIFIARSLGYSTTKKTRYKLNPDGLIHNTYYIACIYGKHLRQIPTKLLLIQLQYALHAPHEEYSGPDPIYPIKITEIGEGDYYGFEIDGNRRFVLGDFTVTHNTVMALKIISLLKQKTLIIVHKEFLLNQWIERIQEFLPRAKVGKIQGQIFDVEGKDIVLGMLQTLYEKEFTIGDQTIANPFASFGLTIIDEVHRIGSEQFSKTLLRVLTPYMLGISATVERKDKLTKILYMFIGPKIYTEKREDEDLVCVRAIEYASPDPEFNELVQDYKGNTQYSSMITKLCAFGPRCDFIVQVIADLVEESPDSQIMILAHNRCLLKYFYEAINHRKIAEVGYYVGGMKHKDLQTTENKQIVLATYAMAAEALDIKTLSTLIMATPKTDIIQSVGRILRVRHENPIVVDIVDSHDIFRNQWKQRKSFYKKCNYRIRSIPSNQYRGMATVDWNGNDQTWKRVFEPKQKTKVIESTGLESKADCTTVQNDSDEDELPGPIKSINNGKCIIEFEDLDDEDNEYI